MQFWILVVAMTLAVLVVLVRPLLRGSRAQAPDENGMRVSIYRENLAELEREYERGQLDQSQLANVRHELELSLLGEIGNDANDAQRKAGVFPGKGRMALIAGVLLVLLAPPLYLVIGNPQLNELKAFSEEIARAPQDAIPPLEGLVPALVQHLEKNPQDANGWLLLADTYSAMSRYDLAVETFAKLYQLTGDDADVMLRYANALIMANNGNFEGQATELVDRVLAIDPQNYTALLYSAFAAEGRGDLRLAIRHYRKIVPALQNNPELLQTITGLIARNEQLLAEQGIVPETDAPADPPAATAAVSLRVSVADDLTGRYAPDDTVFIYAQAMQGPAMPLAVVRKSAAELPIEVKLDDSMAMMPAHKLSAFDQVKVQARISKSGNASPESGDLIGEKSGVNTRDPAMLELVINSVVP